MFILPMATLPLLPRGISSHNTDVDPAFPIYFSEPTILALQHLLYNAR